MCAFFKIKLLLLWLSLYLCLGCGGWDSSRLRNKYVSIFNIRRRDFSQPVNRCNAACQLRFLINAFGNIAQLCEIFVASAHVHGPLSQRNEANSAVREPAVLRAAPRSELQTQRAFNPRIRLSHPHRRRYHVSTADFRFYFRRSSMHVPFPHHTSHSWTEVHRTSGVGTVRAFSARLLFCCGASPNFIARYSAWVWWRHRSRLRGFTAFVTLSVRRITGINVRQCN